MARNQIDGDQVQDDTLTGNDVLDGSLKHEDLESYSFETLDDVDLSTLDNKDILVFNGIDKWINEKIYNVNLFYKRTFNVGENIEIPVDKTLQLHSPKINSELKIDGEGYIL